jgi:6-phosphogluconolactonase (cycloisomerase 2 family)
MATRKQNGFHVLALVVVFATCTAQAASSNAVFSSSNQPGGNTVVIYARTSTGTLSFVGEFETGGSGTGGGLGNQGAVILSPNHQWLLVVNAASNNISVFAIHKPGLTLTDVEPSGGVMPVSLTIRVSGDEDESEEDSNLVYVLNAGDPPNITGFTLDDAGELTPLEDSTQPLSGAPMSAPAEVQFSPDGGLLIVTEKNTNKIDTYLVGDDGLAGPPMVQDSNGVTPFGFGFAKGFLIVSEAFMGAPDASAVSSYQLTDGGDLDVNSGSVPTTETAACWIASTKNGKFTYTTNTGSGTITGYKVKNDGTLTILDADGETGVTGAGSEPTELALSNNSKFMYVLNSATGEIDVFKVNKTNGSLTPIQSVDNLPPHSTGLAAR